MPVTEERLRVLKANNEESHLEAMACIKEALITLLQQKPYSDITMTEIIKKSGVSRSGVYKNYKGKDEIMLDIYNEPIDDVISALGPSVMENIEMIFTTGKKHQKVFMTIINAGLEHNILTLMNRRFEDVSVSFYIPMWNGIIYNAFFEWVRTGMAESVDAVLERVKDGLRLLARSIDADLTNSTQNKRL